MRIKKAIWLPNERKTQNVRKKKELYVCLTISLLMFSLVSPPSTFVFVFDSPNRRAPLAKTIDTPLANAIPP